MKTSTNSSGRRRLIYAPTRSTKEDCRNPVLLFLALAVAIGFSFFARHLIGFLMLGPSYSPLVYNPDGLWSSSAEEYLERFHFEPDAILWDETVSYARYTQEMLRGDIFGNRLESYAPFLLEDGFFEKELNIPLFFDRLGPALLALMSAFLGDIRRAFILADFLFPATVAFLALMFFWRLKRSVPFAIVATSLLMWFTWSDVITFIWIILGQSPNGEVRFLRTPMPQVSFMLFLGFLIVLNHLLDRPGWKATLLLLGPLFSLCVYTYIYSWTFCVALIVAAIALFLLRRTAVNYAISTDSLSKVGAGLGVGVLLASPSFLSFLLNQQALGDVAGRYSTAQSPSLKWTVVVLALLITVLPAYHEEKAARRFWGIYWTGSSLILIQHFVTGVQVQPYHWVDSYIQPMALPYIAYSILIMSEALLQNKKYRGFLVKSLHVGAITIFSVGFTQAIIRWTMATPVQAAYTSRQEDFEELIGFLNRRAQGYVVLVGDPYLDSVLPARVHSAFMRPLFSSPMTNGQVTLLRETAARYLGFSDEAHVIPPSDDIQVLEFDKNKVVVVLVKGQRNRLRFNRSDLLMNNDTFEVGFLSEAEPLFNLPRRFMFPERDSTPAPGTHARRSGAGAGY